MKPSIFLTVATLFLVGPVANAVTRDVAPGDCENINKAIASLPAAGGEIHLGAGMFQCHAPVIIDRDGITLIGAGRDLTILKANAKTPLPVLVVGSPRNTDRDERGIPYPDRVTQNIVVSDLTVDGNFQTHPDAGKFECYDPISKKSLDCSTDAGLFIRNNSLTIRRSQHVRVSRIRTQGAYSGGIVLEKKNVDVVMDDFQSTANFFDGFAGYETEKSHFSKFDIFKNQYSGLSVDWGFEGNSFLEGVIRDNGDNGVFSQDVGRNSFINLEIENNGNLGIYIAGYFDKQNGNKPQLHTCDGNLIVGVHMNNKKGGIIVNSPCESTVILRTTVVHSDGNCYGGFSDAQVTAVDSTCATDAKSPAAALKIK